MNALVFLLLPAVALAAGSIDSRIVNGEDVDIANFPWQGSYRTGSGSHSCGCVFVGDNWVLTAGHCGGSTSYSMEFGSSNRNSGTVISVASVLRHPNYGSGAGFTPNDISVVTAGQNIAGANIAPGTVAPNSDNPGGDGFITGWGRTCGSCSIPVALQGVEIPIISDSECNTRWGSSFQSVNMICVYSGSTGSCNGDSGGPLSQDSTIYGVTSWGVSGCGTNYPSVYTRVGAFNDWVCSNTNGEAQGC